MRILKKIFTIIIASIFIHSCSGFKLKKKSTSGEEFLIEKKDPLILPPNFSKLPKPKDDIKIKNNEEEKIDLENVFSEKELDEIKNIEGETSQDSNLKESILKKIK